MRKRIIAGLAGAAMMVACVQQQGADASLSDDDVLRAVDAAVSATSIDPALVEAGVRQAAALWTSEDGSADDFIELVREGICPDQESKETLFCRLCDDLEAIDGYYNLLQQQLQRPVQLVGYETTAVDGILAAYGEWAHFSDDMFANKLAFIVIMNFPHFSLDEKTRMADSWTDLEWGYARMGDRFTDRIPAQVEQNLSTALAQAEDYISNYNIRMDRLVDADGGNVFPPMSLIAHWGLRDEIKSAYAEGEKGIRKQEMIYKVMERIIDQSIPSEFINSDGYDWNPYDNTLFKNGKSVEFSSENGLRYQYKLDAFRAQSAQDSYMGSDYIHRHFNDELEIPLEDVREMFEKVCRSDVRGLVADVIKSRLGRDLRPYDIWYDGFKERSGISPSELDAMTMARYPSSEAFERDIPSILSKLGFTSETAALVSDNVMVESSVGSGHAWQAEMRGAKALLRTRITPQGMDYKGYNIAVHEFGHNTEQVITLHKVPNIMLSGVPNDSFTEALAFVFQYRDLDLLGRVSSDPKAKDYETLGLFWDAYEIMGVALVDIAVWEWMYDHPQATAQELQEAVIRIAVEKWNEYYADVFGIRDQSILAVYSHMIELNLYLPSYPLGHLVDFQLEEYLRGKTLGQEIERIYSNGCVIPQYWMYKAVGSRLSSDPLIEAARSACEDLGR